MRSVHTRKRTLKINMLVMDETQTNKMLLTWGDLDTFWRLSFRFQITSHRCLDKKCSRLFSFEISQVQKLQLV